MYDNKKHLRNTIFKYLHFEKYILFRILLIEVSIE